MTGRTNAGGVDLEPYKRQISGLTNQVNNLNGQISDLNGQLSGLKGGVPNLKTSVEASGNAAGTEAATRMKLKITGSGDIIKIWNINIQGGATYDHDRVEYGSGISINENTFLKGGNFSDNVFNLAPGSTNEIYAQAAINSDSTSHHDFSLGSSFDAYINGGISRIEFEMGMVHANGAGLDGNANAYFDIFNFDRRYHTVKFTSLWQSTGTREGNFYLNENLVHYDYGELQNLPKIYDVSQADKLRFNFSGSFDTTTSSYSSDHAYCRGVIELS